MIFLLKNGTITTDFLPDAVIETLTERTNIDAREVAHLMQYRNAYIREIARLQEIDQLERLYALDDKPQQRQCRERDGVNVAPIGLMIGARNALMLLLTLAVAVVGIWQLVRGI